MASIIISVLLALSCSLFLVHDDYSFVLANGNNKKEKEPLVYEMDDR